MGNNLDNATHATVPRPREPRLRTLIRATIVVQPNPAAAAGSDREPRHFSRQRPYAEGDLTLVRNISEHGMCLVMRGDVPHRGETICVSLPDGKAFEGQVRWNDRRVCGVELFGRLDVAALVAATQRRNAPFTEVLDERFEAALRPPAPERPPMRPC